MLALSDYSFCPQSALQLVYIALQFHDVVFQYSIKPGFDISDFIEKIVLLAEYLVLLIQHLVLSVYHLVHLAAQAPQVIIDLIYADDQILKIVRCRVQPAVGLSFENQLAKILEVAARLGVFLLYGRDADQCVFYIYGDLEPAQLLFIAFSDYLHQAVLSVLDHALETEGIGDIYHSGPVAYLPHIAGHKCGQPDHHA